MIKHIQANEMNCCGCAACKNICPKNAIEMEFDKKGFEYPQVNPDLCIGCGLCIQTCPINNKDKNEEINDFKQEIYAVINSDFKIRKKSTSGGAFSLLANYVLDKGGKVYGATLDDNMDIRHISVEDKCELDKLRGSKYVQSNIGTTYSEIKDDLNEGKTILFCGTPCQVHGLLNFIPEKLQEKLITIDIVCHGVPSPKIWKDYVKCLEKSYSSHLANYKFRTKNAGWHIHIEEAQFENGKNVSNRPEIYLWGHLFHKNLSLRPHCYVCEYTKYERISDITIGDFWGIEKFDLKMDDNMGTSLVFINTQKGKNVFDYIKNDSIFVESTRERCKQQALFRNTTCKYDKEKFWLDYEKNGFEYIAEKYGHIDKKRLIKVRFMVMLHKLGLLNILYKIIHK